jgi:hypothetical protein
MEQDNLSATNKPDYALFLPAMSSFYISGIGKQMSGETYFDPTRMPQGIPNSDMLNFFSKTGLYNYKWCLYSAGHAELDVNKPAPNDAVIRGREPGTFVLGDSGGFQIFTGQWPADWKDPNCPKAAKKRAEVLSWLEAYSDYAMILDVPSRIEHASSDIKKITGIYTYDDAVKATHINNQYFIKNRKSETCKFLNVLQGGNHAESDDWYEEMKDYCDPVKYPGKHFNGWSAGGMNVQDIHLILKRLVTIIHDGLLEQGKQDWIHYLGTSWLEYAVVFTCIQRAIRKHHNPDFTISFDCASPFYGAAKGQMYYKNIHEHGAKWSYKMMSTAENKKYAGDTRKFSQAVVAEGIHPEFTDSPITDRMTLGDLCYRGIGAVGKHGKLTKTSWDTLSYVLVQSHNVWMHITSVQEANRKFDSGVIPKMLMDERFERVMVSDVIEKIFAEKDRTKSLQIIDDHAWLWKKFRGGVPNSLTSFNSLFTVAGVEPVDELPVEEDPDCVIAVD